VVEQLCNVRHTPSYFEHVTKITFI